MRVTTAAVLSTNAGMKTFTLNNANFSTNYFNDVYCMRLILLRFTEEFSCGERHIKTLK